MPHLNRPWSPHLPHSRGWPLPLHRSGTSRYAGPGAGESRSRRARTAGRYHRTVGGVTASRPAILPGRCPLRIDQGEDRPCGRVTGVGEDLALQGCALSHGFQNSARSRDPAARSPFHTHPADRDDTGGSRGSCPVPMRYLPDQYRAGDNRRIDCCPFRDDREHSSGISPGNGDLPVVEGVPGKTGYADPWRREDIRPCPTRKGFCPGCRCRCLLGCLAVAAGDCPSV